MFFVSGLLDKDLWALWALIISFLALFSHFRQSHREKLEMKNAFNRDSANNSMRDFEREMEDRVAKQKSIEMQIEKNIAIVNSPGS